MAPAVVSALLNFDIDHYLNPFIPRSPLHQLPTSLSRFLGYRSRPQPEPPVPLQWLLQLIVTVAGLCIVSATYTYAPLFSHYHLPSSIASFGAAAVLEFNCIRSPLAQPRGAVVGHTLSAIVGVAISKLFQLHPDFQSIDWISGAVGCACASWAMSLTNTVHPPGGATALLASTQASFIALGWVFVPVVLVGSLLMLGTALVMNNVFQQYPIFWWTAEEDVGSKLPWNRGSRTTDVEAQKTEHDSDTSSARTLRREHSNDSEYSGKGLGHICITPNKTQLPRHIVLEADEVLLLERLQEKLRQQSEAGMC